MATALMAAREAAGYGAGDSLAVLTAAFLPAAEVAVAAYARAEEVSARLAVHEAMLTGLFMRVAEWGPPEPDDWPGAELTDELVEQFRADCLRAYRKGASDGQ